MTGGRTCAVAVFLAGALVPMASAQIVATSLPREPESASPKKWAVHVMASPLAQWHYQEVFIDIGNGYSVLGDIEGTPRSKVMLAAEVSFGRSDGFVVSAGGWYNKVGTHTFDFMGPLTLPPGPDFPEGYTDIHRAIFDTDLTMVEYHAAVSYKGLGLQAGMVSTSGAFKSGEFVDAFGRRRNPPTPYSEDDLPKAETTDYDLFLVYKRGFGRASIAVGAGGYRKQGIEGGFNASPLRTETAKTVPSVFGAASIKVYRGLGVDASYWYIGRSDATDEVGDLGAITLATDQQSRLTLGLGFTF
jgi:hypothetical protein